MEDELYTIEPVAHVVGAGWNPPMTIGEGPEPSLGSTTLDSMPIPREGSTRSPTSKWFSASTSPTPQICC